MKFSQRLSLGLDFLWRFIANRKSGAFHDIGGLRTKSYSKTIDVIPNAKIAVIGLPKSGNNWLMYLIADCLGMKFILDIWDKNEKEDAGITSLHIPFSRRVLYTPDLLHAVYLMRDVRDIVVSYYHYSKTNDYRTYVDPSSYYKNIEVFYYDIFLSKLVPRYDWFHHAEDYIARGLPLVKYEDLWDNPGEELQRLFLRWGIEVQEENVMRAVENNSIEKVRSSGKRTWRQISTTHFRKGGYGNYVEELPDKVIVDINWRFGSYLRRWGYTL